MPGFAIFLFAALAAAGSGASEGASVLASQPPELVDRLHRERFVLLHGPAAEEDPAPAGWIRGLVLFARPKSEVLHLLIQSTRQNEYRPELREIRLVEEQRDRHTIAYRMRMMLMTIEYRAIHRWSFETGEVWWELDPDADNDLARLEGRWKVYALDDGTSLGRFGTRIDVGPALPAFLQDLATRQKLPEAMHNIRRWVDSGGTYRP